MNRREFPPKVKVAAFERAGSFCEGCTGRLYPGKFDYDHIQPAAFGGEPTLENCKVLCVACHSEKTGTQDIPAIAKSNRVRRRHVGIKKQRTIRAWRNMRGEIVRAD